MKRLPVLVSFLLFVALCASGAYWAMQFLKPPARPVAVPVAASRKAPDIEVASKLFGGRTAPVVVASNFQLRGIVMAGNANESLAILSADGKPSQAYPVGQEINPGVSVKEVHDRYVLLSESGVTKRVDMPEPVKSTARPDQPNLGSISTPVPTPAPQSGQVMSAPPVEPNPQPASVDQNALPGRHALHR